MENVNVILNRSNISHVAFTSVFHGKQGSVLVMNSTFGHLGVSMATNVTLLNLGWFVPRHKIKFPWPLDLKDNPLFEFNDTKAELISLNFSEISVPLLKVRNSQVNILNTTLSGEHLMFDSESLIEADDKSFISVEKCVFSNPRVKMSESTLRVQDSSLFSVGIGKAPGFLLVNMTEVVISNCVFVNDIVFVDFLPFPNVGSRYFSYQNAASLVAYGSFPTVILNSNFSGKNSNVGQQEPGLQPWMYGAVINCGDRCNITIKKCRFSHNSNGALALLPTNTEVFIQIEDSLFDSNENSAILYLGTTHQRILVKNCLFKNNTGLCGGAISMGQDRTPKSDDKCGSTTKFGARSLEAMSSYISVSHSTFFNNSADTSGAVYCKHCVLDVSFTNFTGPVPVQTDFDDSSVRMNNCSLNPDKSGIPTTFLKAHQSVLRISNMHISHFDHYIMYSVSPFHFDEGCRIYFANMSFFNNTETEILTAKSSSIQVKSSKFCCSLNSGFILEHSTVVFNGCLFSSISDLSNQFQIT